MNAAAPTESPARAAIVDIQHGLATSGYIASDAIATVLYLARALSKPVLVEGPPGVGKTELANAAAKLIDKIRRDMHARNIVIVEDNMDIGKVTSSFGVAKLEKGQSIEALIKQADDKLYEAKRGGRNCVRGA